MKSKNTCTLCFLSSMVVWFCGCAMGQRSVDGKHSLNCRQQSASAVSQIRTGGLFSSPREITRLNDEPISLRQAVLESGGLKVDENVFLSQNVEQIPEPLPNIRVEPSTLPTNSIAILNSIFEDKSTIIKFFEGDLDIDTYDASLSPDPIEFLKGTIESLGSLVPTPGPRIAEPWFDPLIEDWNSLLEMAIIPFAAYRENDPDYADSVIKKLRSLKTNTSKPIKQSKQMRQGSTITATTERRNNILIGLVRSKAPNETIFFHPQLIHHSAVGDIPLHHKDFVFALPSEHTSLSYAFSSPDDFFIPVTGAAEEYNSVQYSTHPSIRSILTLVDNVDHTNDQVCVFRRLASGKLGSEVFYLPLAVQNTEWASSEELVKDGQARPGDSVIFSYASRSPVVYETLVDPIKKSLEQKRGKLAKLSDQREVLPVDGRFLSKASANGKYYTKSVIRNTNNLFR